MVRQYGLSDTIFENTAHMCTYFSRMFPVLPYTCLSGKELKEGQHKALFPKADFFLIRKNMGCLHLVTLNRITIPEGIHTYEQYLVSPVDHENFCFSLLTDIDIDSVAEIHENSSLEERIMNIVGRQIRQMGKWGKYRIYFASYKGKVGYCGITRIFNYEIRKTQPA